MNKVIKTLEVLSQTENLKPDYVEALNKAVKVLKMYEHRNQVEFNEENIRPLNLSEILNRISPDKMDTVMYDCNVLLLQDDGMGYGANHGYCTDIDIDLENKHVNLWF